MHLPKIQTSSQTLCSVYRAPNERQSPSPLRDRHHPFSLEPEAKKDHTHTPPALKDNSFLFFFNSKSKHYKLFSHFFVLRGAILVGATIYLSERFTKRFSPARF
ncbi:MAG TPA: hypothetical protein DCE42_11660 [Myxococcales bacterium]|nr:hypothetical protein [Myxococcales bacterium]